MDWQNHFISTICNIGIFIICARVLIHFRPKAAYEKYLKMLVSVMILLQLFVPLREIFASENQEDMMDRVTWFQEELEKRRQESLEEYSQKEVAMPESEICEYQEGETQSAEEADEIKIELEEIYIKIGEGEDADAEN